MRMVFSNFHVLFSHFACLKKFFLMISNTIIQMMTELIFTQKIVCAIEQGKKCHIMVEKLQVLQLKDGMIAQCAYNVNTYC